MTIKTTVYHECDECQQEIDTGAEEPWVDAMVYGAIFHLACWRRIGGDVVARLLGLEDIRLRGSMQDGNALAWATREVAAR